MNASKLFIILSLFTLSLKINAQEKKITTEGFNNIINLIGLKCLIYASNNKEGDTLILNNELKKEIKTAPLKSLTEGLNNYQSFLNELDSLESKVFLLKAEMIDTVYQRLEKILFGDTIKHPLTSKFLLKAQARDTLDSFKESLLQEISEKLNELIIEISTQVENKGENPNSTTANASISTGENSTNTGSNTNEMETEDNQKTNSIPIEVESELEKLKLETKSISDSLTKQFEKLKETVENSNSPYILWSSFSLGIISILSLIIILIKKQSKPTYKLSQKEFDRMLSNTQINPPHLDEETIKSIIINSPTNSGINDWLKKILNQINKQSIDKLKTEFIEKLEKQQIELYNQIENVVRENINHYFDNIEKNPNEVPPVPSSRKDIFYLSIPNAEGTFDSSSVSKDYIMGASLYRFNLIEKNIAEFILDENEQNLPKALKYPDKNIDPACETKGGFIPNARKITNERSGMAELQGDKWVITQKAQIRYEV